MVYPNPNPKSMNFKTFNSFLCETEKVLMKRNSSLTSEVPFRLFSLDEWIQLKNTTDQIDSPSDTGTYLFRPSEPKTKAGSGTDHENLHCAAGIGLRHFGLVSWPFEGLQQSSFRMWHPRRPPISPMPRWGLALLLFTCRTRANY